MFCWGIYKARGKYWLRKRDLFGSLIKGESNQTGFKKDGSIWQGWGEKKSLSRGFKFCFDNLLRSFFWKNNFSVAVWNFKKTNYSEKFSFFIFSNEYKQSIRHHSIN